MVRVFLEFCARIVRRDSLRNGIFRRAIAFASRRKHCHSLSDRGKQPRAANNKIELLFGTSLYDLKEPSMPPMTDLVMRDGLRIFRLRRLSWECRRLSSRATRSKPVLSSPAFATPPTFFVDFWRADARWWPQARRRISS